MSLCAMTAATAVAVLGAGSCARIQNPPPSTTTLTSGEVVTPTNAVVPLEDGVARMTDARCSREADCKFVGSPLGYANRDACMQGVHDEIQSELRADLCPRGISETRLFECLGEARTELCNTPRQSSTRLMGCHRDRLCQR
jgi:hypothetical protein